MTLSLSKHFRKPDNNSRHNSCSSRCCLEHTAYQTALKLVTRYLYTLNMKWPETCSNPMTFNTYANTSWYQTPRARSHTHHWPNTYHLHLKLTFACVSTLVLLLYTICRWLGAMAMQGQDAKLALWKGMFANWVARSIFELLVDLARMVAKSCAWPLDGLCCLQRVLSSLWERVPLMPAPRGASISCELSWSRGVLGASVPEVQIRRISLLNCRESTA
jgi:hypothetical protein